MVKINKKSLNYRLKIRKIEILGVKVNFINLKNAISLIKKWLETNKQYQITTPNPEQIILAQIDYRFKNIINNSSLAIADGVGLVWAACWRLNEKHKTTQKHGLAQFIGRLKLSRLSGTDLMVALCQLAVKSNLKVFFLGAGVNPGVAKRGTPGVDKRVDKSVARQTAQKLFPAKKANLYRADGGASNIRKETKKEKQRIIKKINQFRPHFLFVAYGAPWQEKWIAENLPQLKVKIAMGVGGAFDYVSGRVRRAPKIIRKMGLEWLWRLFCQPWRIKRQLALIKFVFLVLLKRFNAKKAS